MNPLVGGLPVDDGWASLRLLTDAVLPHVTDKPLGQPDG